MRKYLHQYLREKPLFFSFLRPKEASLYQPYRPFKKPVLDLGCGDGFFGQLAFEKVEAGIDPDTKAVQEAKRRKVYKEIKFYDGKKIPYKSKYFATVVCNSTFEHILNIDEVLKEAARVTKKGGMLYFTVPTNIWSSYLFGRLLFGKVYETYFINKSKHYNLWSLGQWSKKLAKLGFEVIYHTHYLDNKKVMWFFDISHYASISSLLTKKLFDRWVLFPQKMKLLTPLLPLIIRSTEKNTRKGPYLFIAAKKIR